MDIRKLVSDNLPLILTTTAVTGVVSTTVLAVAATPKALRDIWDAESEQEDPITPLEKVKLTWGYYAPAVVVGGLTVAAIVGIHSVHARRQAAVLGLLSLTEKAYSEYRTKVVETIGENKDKAIRDEVAKDRIENDPVSSHEVIITGAGQHLCYDSITGRYFESDIESIRRAVNDINAQCLNEMYASQNDFYRLINLPLTPFGEEIGWRHDHLLDVSFSAHIAENGRPCLSLDYGLQPIRGYHKINR